MDEARFEIYQDAAGAWRFRLVGRNGEIVATGEAYSSKAHAERGVDTVRRLAATAEVVFVEPD